ncbi:MAG: arginine repressor [Actinomycetes bacterium]
MVKSLSNPTEKRKRIIHDLVSAGKIHSQADLVRELKAKGLEVTQATASRDLQELGAMRSTSRDGEVRYILGANAQSSSGDLILSIASSANTVVLRTPPAAAAFVASTLDAAIVARELPTAIGTIAGDDTVLVIASTATGGSALAKKIASMFGKGK